MAVKHKNLENENMNIKLLSFLAGVILIFGGTVQASCFKSVSLGEYPLGEWSDADRTWVESDTVGSFSEVVTTLSAAQTQRDLLSDQCSKKGKALIDAIEKRLIARKANVSVEFDRKCNDTFFCPMIRDISIRSQEREIESESGRMHLWYASRIDRCKEHFNYTFNILSPRLCSQ